MIEIGENLAITICFVVFTLFNLIIYSVLSN